MASCAGVNFQPKFDHTSEALEELGWPNPSAVGTIINQVNLHKIHCIGEPEALSFQLQVNNSARF